MAGVSGSGKSTLVLEVLAPSLRAAMRGGAPVGCRALDLHAPLDAVLASDQDGLAVGGGSTVATLAGVAESRAQALRRHARGEDARSSRRRRSRRARRAAVARRARAGASSRSRWTSCPDVTVGCETCGGRRFSDDVLSCRLDGRSLTDVLDAPVGDAASWFAGDRGIAPHLEALREIGLPYLRLGQEGTALSSGERQRLRLARLLAAPRAGRTAVLLDEPTRGLGFEDVDRLLGALDRLAAAGHLVVVVEHHARGPRRGRLARRARPRGRRTGRPGRPGRGALIGDQVRRESGASQGSRRVCRDFVRSGYTEADRHTEGDEMKHVRRRPVFAVFALLAIIAPSTPGASLAQAAKKRAETSPTPAVAAGLPSEMPAKFVPVTGSWDYDLRDVMIPMRDGVRLHTVILVPKGAKRAPILLTRTPYDAKKQTAHARSAHLGPSLQGYDNATDVIVEGGYIRAVQDVRGKYGSEGDYVMNRPLHGPLNPTAVDHATDTYDTIDWLVKNVPESNGRVGILGISYDGFLPLMALVNPHPALKVAVPMNPMVDGWMGDDWFHYGAFRQQNLPYIHDQEATRANDVEWWTDHYDDYDAYLRAGSAGEMARSRGLEQVGFWRKLLEHPDVRRVLAGAGDGQGPRGAASRRAGDARPQPLGPGGHLRGDRRLGGAEAEGHGGRQAVPRPRPLASRPGDRRRQHAGRPEVRQRHGALRSVGRSCGPSSTST